MKKSIKLVLAGVLCFVAVGMVSQAETAMGAVKESSYHKEGHLWYKGAHKSDDIEVMPGTYHYNVQNGKINVPRNKTKHMRLYTVSNIPVKPSIYATRNEPVQMSGWDNFMKVTEKQSVDHQQSQRDLPAQIKGKHYAWFNAWKNVWIRIKGAPYVSAKTRTSLGSMSGTLYHVGVNGDHYQEATIVLPDGVKPTDPNAKALRMNVPINSKISTASYAYYFGGAFRQNGVKLTAFNTGRLSFKSYSDNRPSVSLDRAGHHKVSAVVGSGDVNDGDPKPGAYQYLVVYDTQLWYAKNPFKSMNQTVTLNLKVDPQPYYLTQAAETQLFNSVM